MKKEYLGLIIVITIVLIVAITFIIYNQWPYMTGQKIVLATRPVDPFDPFQGQYMQIAYEISNIEDAKGFNEKDTIYVILKEDEKNVWRKDGISASKPSSGDYIKGIVKSTYGNNLRIEYGIEQYFFQRDAKMPTTNITIEVIVARSGRAKIVQLLHNGEPIDIQYEKFDIRA
ncbi:MAG: GDYXXLXY domain-containing protein [Candidatus Pacearchaeota archaeon]|jgi:uncharacterized membrane-anchored protein